MNLEQKLEFARRTVVLSISRHDDAPSEDVEATLKSLEKYIKTERAAVRKRKGDTRWARAKRAARALTLVFR